MFLMFVIPVETLFLACQSQESHISKFTIGLLTLYCTDLLPVFFYQFGEKSNIQSGFHKG